MDVRHLLVDELRPPLKVRLVADADGLNSVRDFFSRVTEFGFDTETNVTKTFIDRRIRTIQVGNRDEQYVIDLLAFAGSTQALEQGQGSYRPSEWSQPLVELLKPVLESYDYLKVGTYLQFDYEVMKWCLGIRCCNFYDCHIAEKCINAGRASFWEDSLEELTLRYVGRKINKELQSSFDLESPITPEQLVYAALDTRLPLAIRSGQGFFIDKYGLTKTINMVENPAIPAFGDMHLNGMLLSSDKWMALIDAKAEEHRQNVKELDKFFLPVVGGTEKPSVDLEGIEKAWRDEKDKAQRATNRQAFYDARRVIAAWEKNSKDWEGQAAINYASHDAVLKTLWKMGFTENKLPNTNDRTLHKLNQPVIKALQNYRETEKIKTTYGVDFLENINGFTKRIHSRVNQIGAGTGRTSSSNPNLQNIPKKPEWRACFVARDDNYSIITIDMSGAELRILAEASMEQVWVEAFSKGWDVHSVGAEILFGQQWKDGAETTCAYYHTADHQKCKCKVHKDLRDRIKAINFGLAYGMEAKKLSESLDIAVGEAQQLLDLYRATFKTVTKYLHGLGESAKLNLVARTLGGRVRWFTRPDWNAAKQKCNEEAKGTPVTPKDIGRKYHGLYSSIEREGKNTPIQGGNADIAKLWMALIWDRLETEFGAFLIMMVHDELVVECPKTTVDACKAFLAEKCSLAGSAFLSSVVMESEAHVGDHWIK